MENESESEDEYESGMNQADVITNFNFRRFLPSQQANEQNKKNKSLSLQSPITECNIKIEHSNFTNLESVGLQIWNGALLLADYIIHCGNSIFHDKNVLELASGIGLVGIIASMYCARVTCTDINDLRILEVIQKNIKNNKELINAKIYVKVFNFFDEWSPDIEEEINQADVIFASEVIYDNQITDALIEQLIKIMNKNSKITIYMTMEKRYIFSAINLRVEAKHYDYFFERLKDKDKILNLNWKMKQMKIDFPQYFPDYERNKELELWRISR